MSENIKESFKLGGKMNKQQLIKLIREQISSMDWTTKDYPIGAKVIATDWLGGKRPTLKGTVEKVTRDTVYIKTADGIKKADSLSYNIELIKEQNLYDPHQSTLDRRMYSNALKPNASILKYPSKREIDHEIMRIETLWLNRPMQYELRLTKITNPQKMYNAYVSIMAWLKIHPEHRRDMEKILDKVRWYLRKNGYEDMLVGRGGKTPINLRESKLKSLVKRFVNEQISSDEDRFVLEVMSFVRDNNLNNVKNKLSRIMPKYSEGEGNPEDTNKNYDEDGFYSFYYFFDNEKDALYHAKKIINQLGEKVVVYVRDTESDKQLFHDES